MRVLHMPDSTGNNAWNLAIGENKNGSVSKVMITNPTKYSSQCDFLVKSRFKPVLLVKYWLFCHKMVKYFDVVHYNYGRLLFNIPIPGLYGWDVRFFKRHGKVVAVSYQGSDARQPKYNLENYRYTYFDKNDINKKNEKNKQRKIRYFEKYADLIYTTQPDLLNTLPKKARFRQLTKLQPEEWTPIYSDYDKEETVIVHGPSNKKYKGTIYIEEAIEKLKRGGYKIRYLRLENIPRNEVIEYYKKADLAIDQILSGWYGGFSVECMALGKPVVCYIRDEDMKYIPVEMNDDMPLIRADIDNLYDILKYYLDNKKELEQIAIASRQYVEKWHDPRKIAKSIMKDYERCIKDKNK